MGEIEADASAAGFSVPRVGRTPEQILKLTRYQLREYLRSRRFIILSGLVVTIGIIITAVVAHFRGILISGGAGVPGDLGFYGSFWGGGADLVIVLAAVFFGGDAIAGEFQNKTGYFLMGLPIRRLTVYVGKFIAAFVASVSMLLLFLVILVLNGAYYSSTTSTFGSAFPWQLGLSLVLAIVYLMAVMGATFLFSSLFKTSAYGFVLTAILFLFGFTLLQDVVQGLAGIQPWMVISYASSSIGNVFGTGVDSCTGMSFQIPINWGLNGVWGVPGGSLATQGCPPGGGPGGGRGFGGGVPTWTAGIGEAVVIMVGYFLVMAVLGLFLFEREEFS